MKISPPFPLPLAVLLLEDNNKIIDINLPIEGDIDSPEFKYTSLIFKAFVNLISKAITSPFKLLAGAIGLGEDENLEAIGFEAGSYALLPQQKEILDKLAQAMQKRDKLGIIIDGGYDKTVDSEAIKVRKLKQKVLEQTTNRRSSINILEDIFVDANSKFELDKLQQEVKKGIKSTSNYDVAYQKELTKRCAALEVVTDIDILDLANHRASTIQTYFVEKKEISQNRVKIATSVENIAPDKGLIKTKFRLNTN